MNHIWTRRTRFARSLDEAFRTPRYGAAIEIPTRRPGIGRWMLACIAAAAMAAIYVIAN